jgi:hypothetical protein
MSFVAQVTNTTWGGVELVKGTNASLFIGCCFNGKNWGWGTRGAPDAVSTTSPFINSLLVYRFDYTPTNTAIRLYVNPSSLSAEPTNADVSGTEPRAIAFDELRVISHGFYGSGVGPDGLFDELRVGGSWAAVTPHTIRTDAPFSLKIVPGGIIQDSKPAGVADNGFNFGTTWLASSTDFNSVTRTGVEQFVVTNNSQITIPASPDLNNTNGTISFWMQYNFSGNFPGSGSEAAMLFDCRTTNGTVIAINKTGNIQFQSLKGASFISSTVNGYVVDGNWHNVAITYGQTTNDAVTLYIDGVLDTTVTNPAAWSWPTNQEIELGRSHDPYWFVYNGQMDDFRMYNRILTPAEVSIIGTEATSDTLVDTNALKVRFNFTSSSALFGNSIVWPYGVLQSSPALGTNAVWTSLTNAVSPQPFTTSTPSTFYRLFGTP